MVLIVIDVAGQIKNLFGLNGVLSRVHSTSAYQLLEKCRFLKMFSHEFFNFFF